MDGTTAFGCGVFGGVTAELLQWYRIRERLSGPTSSASVWYWVVTGLMILVGGGLATLYVVSSVPLTPILAFNVGLTAPLVLAAASKNIPETELNTS